MVAWTYLGLDTQLQTLDDHHSSMGQSRISDKELCTYTKNMNEIKDKERRTGIPLTRIVLHQVTLIKSDLNRKLTNYKAHLPPSPPTAASCGG